MFCAQIISGGRISPLEKGKVDNYLQEIRVGYPCLRSDLDLLQRRCKSGVMGSGSVDKVEENSEEAAAIYDGTINSPIDLHTVMLAQGVPYDLELHNDDLTLFEGTGTGQSITSISCFLQNQEAVTAFFSRINDECHGASNELHLGE
jgi:hypothetical protein